MSELPATFRCDRQGMTLTVAGCKRLWTSAQERRPDPWEGRHACLSCPIGATHCGQSSADAKAAAATEALRKFCPRCSRRATRLINGEFCVSCYNRVREIARGRNCKGNPPIEVAARIHSVTLSIGTEIAPAPAIQTFSGVASRAEAMILAAKAAKGRVVFGAINLSLIPSGAPA
jgi:hypothetical protein